MSKLNQRIEALEQRIPPVEREPAGWQTLRQTHGVIFHYPGRVVYIPRGAPVHGFLHLLPLGWTRIRMPWDEL